MVEPQRTILLPAPDSVPSARTRALAMAPWVPAQAVGAPPPVLGATARTARDAGAWFRQPRLDDETGGGRQQAIAGIHDEASRCARLVAGTPGTPACFASTAFLAQQIYQEAMPSGLHREPWAEGIGAYRRAGAAPPLESGAPAVVCLAV